MDGANVERGIGDCWPTATVPSVPPVGHAVPEQVGERLGLATPVAVRVEVEQTAQPVQHRLRSQIGADGDRPDDVTK
jgi:hypothetical protein